MGLLGVSGLFCLLALSASAGPLSERILFVSPVHNRWKLFICRSDGRDLVRLTSVKGDQLDPHFSPALGRVFFVRPVRGRDQICSVDLEGDDFQVHVQGVFHARNPHVHPSGKKLVFSTDKWAQFELAEWDLESEKLTRLTYGEALATHPRYSPDGNSILFLSRRHGQSELYLMTPENGEYRRLTNSPFHEGPGSWSPDGSRVIATRVMPPKKRTRLLELQLEGATERLLLHKTEQLQAPTYSADGSQIMFLLHEELMTYHTSDTAPKLFPLRGTMAPQSVQWITIPLP